MKAELTVQGATYDEIWADARERFKSFFGEHQPKIEALEARPYAQVLSGTGLVVTVSWEIDFEARL